MSAFDALFRLEDDLAASALEIQRRDGAARQSAESRYAELLGEYEAQGGYDYQSQMERVVLGCRTSARYAGHAGVAGERRRADSRRTRPRTPRRPRSSGDGRADKLPGLRRAELAGRLLVGLQVRRAGGVARPLLPRPRLHRDVGDRARPAATLSWQLLEVPRLEDRSGSAAEQGVRASARVHRQGGVFHPALQSGSAVARGQGTGDTTGLGWSASRLHSRTRRSVSAMRRRPGPGTSW